MLGDNQAYAMRRHIYDTPEQLSIAAAHDAAACLRSAIAVRGEGRIVVATGASQFRFLEQLVREPEIDWTRVTMFHLDEYIGLAPDHPAGFGRYLHERLIDIV